MRDYDVVVLGAGIYGCSTAYFLARAGVRVLVVDAEDIGAGGSGANSGNIHLQLSPFSHAAKDDTWVAEFARTLPFFMDALDLWKRLARELPGNIELRCPGGIMLAETDRQMQLLHENPALTRDAIKTALQPSPDVGATLPPALRALADSGLQDQVEQLSIKPEFLSTEEMSKFWTATLAHYRPSAAYEVSVVLIQAEQKLMSRADQLIVLVDSSKFRTSASFVVCGLADIDIVVTDAGVSDAELAMLRDQGIEVIVAEGGGRA